MSPPPPRCRSTIWGSFRRSPPPSIWPRGRPWGMRWRPSSPPPGRWGCRPASGGASWGPPRPSRPRWPTNRILILAALLAVYIVLGMLVRELRPPHHHPLHPAVGGGGSAYCPAAHRHGVEPHCRHRHHPADRHRQEERHHDGGLCPGGGAPRRPKRPEEAIYEACLLRFRPIMMTTMAALLGALPLALGTRRGLRAAPPPGHLHRRRPDLQPDDDPLYHPGDLSLSGPLPALG